MKVGLTGGIGSGKSQVAKIFSVLGVPVLNADDTARFLMEHDSVLIQAVSAAFGNEVYKNGRLNRPFLASVVFNDAQKLEQLNSLVHPATIAYGNAWARQQQAPYTLKEAALFFESGSYREMDVMLGVYSPAEMRLQRVMRRDVVAEQEVIARMSRQMNEEEKMKRCDFVIRNDESISVLEQVLELHEKLVKMAKAKIPDR